MIQKLLYVVHIGSVVYHQKLLSVVILAFLFLHGP